MAYVLTENIDDAYIQSLITRAGFIDQTANPAYADWGGLYVVQDLNGLVQAFNDISALRDWLILQYLIQQNS